MGWNSRVGTIVMALFVAASACVALGGQGEEDYGYTGEHAWEDWQRQYLALGVSGLFTRWDEPQADFLNLGAHAALYLGEPDTRLGIFARLDAPKRLDEPGIPDQDSLTTGLSLEAWLFDIPTFRPYVRGEAMFVLQPAAPRWNVPVDYSIGGTLGGGFAVRTDDLILRLGGSQTWLWPGELYWGPDGPEFTPEDVLVTTTDVYGLFYLDRWHAGISFSSTQPVDEDEDRLLSWDIDLSYGIGWGWRAGGGLTHAQETTYWKLLVEYARGAAMLFDISYREPLPTVANGLQPLAHWALSASLEVRLGF